MQRSAPKNLEFQRELTKLAAVTHRQFEIALADCQFEPRVCGIFQASGQFELPALFLFKENQIWQYSGQRMEFTKETFLEYLSGDNFKDQSKVFDADMQGWVEQQLGISGGMQRTVKRYTDWFEANADQYSKDLFKALNLHHWSQ